MTIFGDKLQSRGAFTVAGAPDGCRALVLAGLMAGAGGKHVVYVAPNDAVMARISNALPFFAPELECISFPAWDCLPYDRISPNGDILARRLYALTALAAAEKPLAIVTTVNAILQRVPKQEIYKDASLEGRVGARIEQETLISFFEGNGYTRAGTVREAGEYAVRGDIIDMFPPGAAEPLRLDFFGDELEGIRSFDAMTQRTTADRQSFQLKPVSEVTLEKDSIARFRSKYRSLFGATATNDPIYEAISAGRRFIGMEHWLPLFHEGLATLFDYMPGCVLAVESDFETTVADRFEMIADYYEARRALVEIDKKNKQKGDETFKPVPPEQLFLTKTEWEERLSLRPVARLTPFDTGPDDIDAVDWGARVSIDFAPVRAKQDVNIFDEVVQRLSQEKDRRVLVTATSDGARDRIGALLAQHGLNPPAIISKWSEFLDCAAGQVALATVELEHGFARGDGLVVTEQDILGDRLTRPARRRRRGEAFLTEADSLALGDLVVHEDHGIGRFDGLETLQAGGAPHECLRVLYHGDDKLFVPVENIEVLSRYGSEDATANLDRLGAQNWQARKAQVKEKIREIAGQLIAVAAARAVKKGERLQSPEGAYEEFCARFPYAETEDQLNAIADVLGDMSSGRPMDRLICGDVGFGKTEVALRAAFVAAMNGYQVAVVVPTTLLALQHYATFKERFTGLPVRIAQLSRFVGAKEAQQTRDGLTSGDVEIVVGTHALLGKSVKFSNLGLLVVDEEQHFGVAQKERLKQLKSNVHVLTLTATPIPRTLQMALSGVRELSIIATAPVDRLAVRTFVLPFDPVVIREAITRERNRGGQVFYVCPRVADLNRVERRLNEILPDLRIARAHGQMAAGDLEQVMADFFDAKYDLLLCTQIVESGLDIPSVNTMIIHRAGMFGLAQLYQLRGRIGRSKTRAYCYLTVPPDRTMTATAQRRLEVMQTLDTLGAGFTLASYDLDIRGAGNLLGDEQSGHIKEVGVELYQHMLEEAVSQSRGDDSDEQAQGWTPQISLGMSVMIPEAYVSDLSVRLGLYRRLSALTAESDIEAFAAELIDRFGPIPNEVENLISVITIKGLCRQAYIGKIDAGPKGAVFAFYENQFPNPGGLIGFIQKHTQDIKLRPDHSLLCQRDWFDTERRIKGVRKVVQELAQIAAAAD